MYTGAHENDLTAAHGYLIEMPKDLEHTLHVVTVNLQAENVRRCCTPQPHTHRMLNRCSSAKLDRETAIFYERTLQKTPNAVYLVSDVRHHVVNLGLVQLPVAVPVVLRDCPGQNPPKGAFKHLPCAPIRKHRRQIIYCVNR